MKLYGYYFAWGGKLTLEAVEVEAETAKRFEMANRVESMGFSRFILKADVDVHGPFTTPALALSYIEDQTRREIKHHESCLNAERERLAAIFDERRKMESEGSNE